MNAEELVTREDTPGKLPKEAKAVQKAAQDGDPMHPEELQSQAYDQMRSAYYTQVKEAASSLIEEIKTEGITDYERFDDYFHQYVDGHRQVFITWLAQATLLVSENDDAYEDQGMPMDESATVEARAYFAFKQDVEEEFERQTGMTTYDYFENMSEEEEVEEEPEMDENMFGNGEPEEDNPY